MSKGTGRRSVRVEDELWDAAKEAASKRGDNLSDIIRQALARYVNNHSDPRFADPQLP